MKYLSQDDFEITDNFITINFRYNNNALQMLDSNPIKVISNLTEQEQIIIDYIKKYGFIRRSTVEDILNVKKSRANKILSNLVDKKILSINGEGHSSKYILL